MYAEVSALVSRYAIDPREFHLFAFGGAGAMLACFLARELDMKGVVVPPVPGVVSALGGLVADLKNDFIRTIYCDVTEGEIAALAPTLDRLEDSARAWLAAQAYRDEGKMRWTADMRYLGQSFEIETEIEAGWLRSGNAAAVTTAFHREHERLYGHADTDAAVQMINLRLVITGATQKPALLEIPEAGGPLQPGNAVEGWFDGRSWKTHVYHREQFASGHRLQGPAIIAQDDTTTVVPPGFELFVDRFGNLIITREEF
jgi:N-methylhydantoinase A